MTLNLNRKTMILGSTFHGWTMIIYYLAMRSAKQIVEYSPNGLVASAFET